jgi:hypothetical protein
VVDWLVFSRHIVIMLLTTGAPLTRVSPDKKTKSATVEEKESFIATKTFETTMAICEYWLKYLYHRDNP